MLVDDGFKIGWLMEYLLEEMFEDGEGGRCLKKCMSQVYPKVSANYVIWPNSDVPNPL